MAPTIESSTPTTMTTTTMPETFPNFRRLAARLFRVHEQHVTPHMEARVRQLAPSAPSAPGVTRPLYGVECPDCRQSATGMYVNKAGCARCGWSAGKFTRRLARFF